MIRLVQRKLIIPRGDTGNFSLPVPKEANTGDVAVFTIIDPRTNTKVYEKITEPVEQLITIVFTHNDTVNLPVGRYLWDVKFYVNATIADGKVVNGDEVDSYYAAYTLPECEVRQTGDDLMTSDDSPSSTLTPESLNIITAAITEATQAKNAAAASAAEAQGYAEQITGLSAEAETLPAGASATASYDAETGVLTLGLPRGDAFSVAKTYPTIAAMNADYSGSDTSVGDFVMIVSTIGDPDNAKLYVKGAERFEFVVDMSGANGVGVQSIVKSGTVENVDTYTITYTDGTTTTYNVVNGVDGDEYTVMVQDTQPTQETNKLWIPIAQGVVQEVPTVQEMNAAIAGIQVPVEDVQVNGVSVVTSGVAEIPVAGSSNFGAVKINSNNGIDIVNMPAVAALHGTLKIASASDEILKAGTSSTRPVVANNEHTAAFYGLAKAAGDTTQSQSSNSVGTYTDNAKSAIRTMLGAGKVDDVQVNGASVVQDGVANVPIASASTLGVVSPTSKTSAMNQSVGVDASGKLWTEAITVDPVAIESAVTDWLDDHPEATTTVEDGSITKAKLATPLQNAVDSIPTVDATLTTTGAAADAKKTGDELSDLKSQEENLEDRLVENGTIRRLFRVQKVYDYTTVYSNGLLVNGALNQTAYIFETGGSVTVKATGGNNYGIFATFPVKNETQTIDQTRHVGALNNKEIAIPSGANYLVIVSTAEVPSVIIETETNDQRITAIESEIGNTPLGTNADTITGAIAEHSDLVTYIPLKNYAIPKQAYEWGVPSFMTVTYNNDSSISYSYPYEQGNMSRFGIYFAGLKAGVSYIINFDVISGALNEASANRIASLNSSFQVGDWLADFTKSGNKYTATFTASTSSTYPMTGLSLNMLRSVSTSVTIGNIQVVQADSQPQVSIYGNLAEQYDRYSTYSIGEYVIKDNVLKRCTIAITVPEEWNGLHWTDAELGYDLNSLRDDLAEETARAENEEARIEGLFSGVAQEAVDEWFAEHPDAAVQDGAINTSKLSDDLKNVITPLSRFSGATDEERLYDALITQSYRGIIAGGNITINNTITIPNRGIRSVKIINAKITLGANMFTTEAAYAHIPTFINCTFKGNGYAVFGGNYAISGYFVDCVFQDCAIMNNANGLLQSPHVVNCEITNNLVSFIKCKALYDAHIINVMCESQSSTFIDTIESPEVHGGTPNLWVSNSLFEGYKNTVFKLSGGNVVIKDCYFEGNDDGVLTIQRNVEVNAVNKLTLELSGNNVYNSVLNNVLTPVNPFVISGFDKANTVNISIHDNYYSANQTGKSMVSGVVGDDEFVVYSNKVSVDSDVICSDQLPVFDAVNIVVPTSGTSNVTISDGGFVQYGAIVALDMILTVGASNVTDPSFSGFPNAIIGNPSFSIWDENQITNLVFTITGTSATISGTLTANKSYSVKGTYFTNKKTAR